MPTHIAVPDERAEQLRRFAERESITIADALGRVINFAIDKGLMDDGLPGFRVERLTGKTPKVLVEVEGVGVDRLSRFDAINLAERLEFIAEPDAEKRRQGLGTFALSMIQVFRVGTGVRLGNPAAATWRVIAPSVAIDLAKLIRKAAS